MPPDNRAGLKSTAVKLGTLLERPFGEVLANVRFVPAEAQTEAVVREAIAELGRIDQAYTKALGERLNGATKRAGP